MNQADVVVSAAEDMRLPALIDRARTRLEQARSSAEVLEAKAIAESALHYAKLTKAANETHADCLRMIVRAEMRMATEIDRGQERGEVASKGRPVNVADDNIFPATLSDLGIRRDQLHNWREVRDAGEAVVEAAITQALEEQRPPTKADIQRAVENRPHVSNNSGNNEWYTPPEFIQAARATMGAIDLDPASSPIANQTVGALHYFTAEINGLTQPWHGNVWMNPPYAQPLIAQFADAVSEKYDAQEIKRACVLVNNATETGWFQRLLRSASAVCFLRTRIRFLDLDGRPSGAPLQGQAVVYLGENPARFCRAFADLGTVLVKP